MPVRSSETRRIHSLLGQRRVSDVMMVIILSVGFLAGLVGFAVHVLWIVAILVLALGLGYVVANARQDRREAIDRHREDEERAVRLARPYYCGPPLTIGKEAHKRVPKVCCRRQREKPPDWRSGDLVHTKSGDQVHTR